MEDNKTTIIGYWNKDTVKPEFIFTMPNNIEEYELVMITVEPIKAALKNTYVSKELLEIKRGERGMRNLFDSIRKIKNVK
jgi:hypothetical protein